MKTTTKFRTQEAKMFLLFFLGCFFGFSQNSGREYKNYQIENNSVTITTSDGHYRFQSYSPEIFETSFIPTGEEFNANSHAVVMIPQEKGFEVFEEAGIVTIDTPGIDVIITKSPFQITYFYNGEEVISEAMGYSKDKDHQKISFNIGETEKLFGGGARALGMDRRGNRLELYNKAHYGYEATSELLNYSLPIVFSSAMYMLHFDNAPIGFLDLDSEGNNRLTYETISGRKTYQLVVGETWSKIVENYTALTGRQPMPPRWALGNFSSRFGYHSQEEVLSTINKFNEDNIPVDAVVIDLYWFGHEIQGTLGNLKFVRDSFPNPREMMTNLKEQGVQTILVTEPFILTTSNRWEEAVAQDVLVTNATGKPFTFDFYFGNSGLIDIFKLQARDWFWNIYRELSEMGVSGWWGDLGEPEAHPEELQHVTGTANEMHNIYGHSWAEMIYNGYREDFPQQRPFILMRAGAAGSQRFGFIPWSGDVNRSWGGLQSQPEIALQMGVQGLGYMHSDLGGFAGENLDDELYVRWLQYGVFQPIYRPHGQEQVPSEPVFREPAAKALAKKAIELRYQLLPYNYTLAFENSQNGTPLMRPLFFEEPLKQENYNVSQTYLWGNDFLISPVLEGSLMEKEIHFPATANWFDFYTGKKYQGGTTQNVPVTQDNIPTYVRGGAFIPMARPMQNTSEYTGERMQIHFYFDDTVKTSNSYIYHDDGETPNAFEKGMYERFNLESNLDPTALNLKVEKIKGENVSSGIGLVEVVVENLKKDIGFVWVNTLKFTAKNYMHQGKLVIPVRFDQNITTIKIEFN